MIPRIHLGTPKTLLPVLYKLQSYTEQNAQLYKFAYLINP